MSTINQNSTIEEIKVFLGKDWHNWPNTNNKICFIADDEYIIDYISDNIGSNYNRSVLFGLTDNDTITSFITMNGINLILYVFNKPGDKGLLLFATYNIDYFVNWFKHSSDFSITLREKAHILKESMLKSKNAYLNYQKTGKMPKQMGPINVKNI